VLQSLSRARPVLPPRAVRVLGALAAVAIVAVSGCAGGGTSAAHGAVRLGYQTNVWGMPIYTAIANDCFEQQHIQLQEIQVDSGNRVRDLMVAEQADVGTFAGPTLNIALDKSDIVAVGMVGTVARTTAIVARQGTGIRTLDDLRGKKIAIQSGSSVGDVAVQQILPSVNLTEGDYELVNIPVTNMVSALVQGQVEAMVNVEPYNAIAVSQGVGTRIADFADYDPLPVFIGMRQQFIDEHHDQAVGILKALLMNAQTWKTTPDAVYDTIAHYYTSTGIDVDRSVIRDAASRMDVQADYLDGADAYLRGRADLQKEEGQISQTPDYSKALNSDLLEEAKAATPSTATCP
jgi:NitT/TauT family transport system substrate-binding protein